MEITYKQVSDILKTLPISYYLKTKAKVSLSKDEKNSYIDLVSKNIVISFEQIKNSVFSDDEELEKDIRVKLYHEVSHAILSPLPRKLTIDKDVYNCFEDERIENLLEGYYLDTEFKQNILKNHKNYIPDSPFAYFFYCVRLRGGGHELNNEIDNLILKWKGLHYDIRPQNLTEYQKDINELYRKIVRNFRQQQDNFSQLEDVSSSCELINSNTRISEEEMQCIMKDISSKLEIYQDKDFRKQAELIINSRNKEKSNNSESKPSYSGRLNVRKIGKPNDDYKWFTKSGDGLANFNQGLKLNLFIDQSGSYRELEIQTNSLLKELAIIERKIKDFKFDLVVIDTDLEIKDKRHRFIECGGGNCLSPDLTSTFFKVRSLDSKNINLVLFNGDMATDSYERHGIKIEAFSDFQYQCLTVFNKSNTIIISDNANKKALDRYCKQAKVIYTKDYLNEFKKYILKSLKILIK